jgi:hypothetical protein
LVAARVEIKFYCAFVLNRRVVLHAIDATPARWRGDAGSSPLDGASAATSSPTNDLVKNFVHPTHWLISTQAAAFAPSGDPDAVDYREFLKFVRDAGGRLDSQGPSATPRLVDASSKAYDGFYGGGSSDDDDYRPRRRNPPRSPVTRQRRTLFQGDSAPETAWRA